MNFEHPLFLLVVGSIVVASMLIKDRLERIHVPPLLGYIGVGLGLAVADERWQILLPAADWALEFLADVGVVCLLFRVGLTSNPLALYRQLPRVIPVWTGDVVCAALSGYAAARYGLGFPHLSALVVATALSATSLGVTAGVWSVGGAIRSRLGQQLVDVAELDDLSTVLLMVLLFSAVPMVAAAEPTEGLSWILLTAGAWLALKGVVFGALCLAVARWIERPLTAAFTRLATGPDPAIAVAGTGMVIASLAGLLGFSVAIGALFAGLVFSRDPATVRMQPFFSTIYDLFTPFFFVAIGRLLHPEALGSGVGCGLVLLVAGVLGKGIGAGVPIGLMHGRRPALLIAISMAPRAEIALFVAITIKEQVPSAVPDGLYAGIVFVSAVTCLASPLTVRGLLTRWRDEPFLQPADEEGEVVASAPESAGAG